MTIVRLHVIRRLLLGMHGTISALLCEIEAELRARGWRPTHGESQHEGATTHNQRVS